MHFAELTIAQNNSFTFHKQEISDNLRKKKENNKNNYMEYQEHVV